jgi:hypothetical protein
MKKLIVFACLVVMLMLATSVSAQELVFASGGKGGTYAAFFDQIRTACSAPALVEMATSDGKHFGSVENVKNLMANKANVGIVQEDILWARKLIDDDPKVDTVKAVLALYPEEVNIIALARSNITSFSKLGNKKVASFGGSVLTTKVVLSKTRIKISGEVRETGTAAEAIALLDNGKVEAVIAVGGQPMDWIANLPNKFKLVPFDMFADVNKVYTKAVLSATSYPNLLKEGIPTIATWSMLVTKDYKTEGKIGDINKLYNCIISKLPEITETTGTHPKWELVSVDNNKQINWPVYDKLQLQKAKVVAPVTPKTTKPAKK